MKKENEMEKPIEHYWMKRVEDLKESLEVNNFEVFIAGNRAEATQQVGIEALLGWRGSCDE